MRHMRRVLVLNGYYLPGIRGGGPIRSISNLIEGLSDYAQFSVLCGDRDLDGEQPYSGIVTNTWTQAEYGEVFYMSPGTQNLGGFQKILNTEEYDTLYLNSFYSFRFTIIPLILRRLGKLRRSIRTVMAPRGDLCDGFAYHGLRKRIYCKFARIVGLDKGLVWHATSKIEAEGIRRNFPEADIIQIPNFFKGQMKKGPSELKKKGELRVAFLSRIVYKKNLKGALEIISSIHQGEVIFDIFGPIEDDKYWDNCRRIIDQAPENIHISYKGELSRDQVLATLRSYHAYLLPTYGENYGHTIVEALVSGCVCILTKGTTPWDSLQDNGGFLAELDDLESFRSALETLIDMEQQELSVLAEKSISYIEKLICNPEWISLYCKLFDIADGLCDSS